MITDNCSLITIWLCSSKDDELKDLILGFAKELDSPSFVPHITLLGSVELEDTVAYCKAVELVAEKLNSLGIELNGIGYDDFIWRCFYYKAFPKEVLLGYHLQLVKNLAHFGAKQAADFMPHLSLIYDDLDIVQQEFLLKKHTEKLVPRTLHFDTIKVVHFIPDDIENWEVLASFPLSPKGLSL